MSMIKRMAIIVVSVIAVVFMAFTVVGWLWSGEFFFLAPSYSKMDRYLKANIDELSYVADALFELDYDSITIHRNPRRVEDKYDTTMQVSREYLVYETIPIPDELLDHIVALYESGVRYISCGHDSVGFSIWAFMGDIRGIIYSRTGEKPDGGHIIEVRQLSKENWYYYVDNFEKWKARNPELFQ